MQAVGNTALWSGSQPACQLLTVYSASVPSPSAAADMAAWTRAFCSRAFKKACQSGCKAILCAAGQLSAMYIYALWPVSGATGRHREGSGMATLQKPCILAALACASRPALRRQCLHLSSAAAVSLTSIFSAS